MSDRTSRVPIPPYELPLLPLTAKEVQNLTALINTRSGIAKVSDTLASAITALGNATLELYPDPDEENEEKDKAMADMEKLARELVDENKRALDMKEALESIVNAQREALRRGDEPRESSEEQGLSGQYESILVAKKRRWDAMNNTEKYILPRPLKLPLYYMLTMSTDTPTPQNTSTSAARIGKLVTRKCPYQRQKLGSLQEPLTLRTTNLTSKSLRKDRATDVLSLSVRLKILLGRPFVLTLLKRKLSKI